MKPINFTKYKPFKGVQQKSITINFFFLFIYFWRLCINNENLFTCYGHEKLKIFLKIDK